MMLVRTTISLDDQLLQNLQQIAKEKKSKSFSAFIKNALSDYIKTYKEKKLYDKLAKNYQEYACDFSKKDFEEMEEAALSDI